MRIERFDPMSDHAALMAHYKIYALCQSADDPDGPMTSWETFRTQVSYPWQAWPRQMWLASDERSGDALGSYAMDLPDTDNLDRCQITLAVAPDKRRHGLGRRLLAHAMEQARDNGRRHMAGRTKLGSPGEAFAQAVGARPVLAEKRYVLDMAALSLAHVTWLHSEAERHARGYSLMSWTGPTPDEHLEQVADLIALISDVPRPEGDEEYLWGIQHVRNANNRIIRRRLRHYTALAQAPVGGSLAGMTQISVAPDDADWAFQELTVVARDHRGHRLGLLLKTVMLQTLLRSEPQLRHIFTGTADANTHMNRINDMLGFQALDEWAVFSLST